MMLLFFVFALHFAACVGVGPSQNEPAVYKYDSVNTMFMIKYQKSYGFLQGMIDPIYGPIWATAYVRRSYYYFRARTFDLSIDYVSPTPCSQLPSTNFLVNLNDPELGGWNTMWVLPSYDTGKPLANVATSTCCLTSPSSCPSGTSGTMAYYDMFLTIEMENGDLYQDVGHVTCKSCIYEDRSSGVCPGGTYASAFVERNFAGIITNSIQCIPCAPGTWNTCRIYANCSWKVPDVGDTELDISVDYFRVDGYLPVGECYPCSKAGSGRLHYAAVPSLRSQILRNDDDPLPWYCPGNEDYADGVPRPCNTPYVGSTSDHSRCACPPGEHSPDPGVCVLCPAGFYCVDNKISSCQDHTYQSLSGQTSCASCTADKTATGAPTVSCPPNQKLRQCVGAYKASDLTCVSCNFCKGRFSSSTQGKVDCYST